MYFLKEIRHILIFIYTYFQKQYNHISIETNQTHIHIYSRE